MLPVVDAIAINTQFRMKTCLLILLTLFSSFISLNLSAQTAFLTVNKAFKFSGIERINETEFEASWGIEEGYYLYQKRFKLSLENNETIPLQFEQTGKLKQDANFGKVRVFYQNAKFKFSLSDSQLMQVKTLKLVYQGCADAGLCYPPQTRVIALEDIKSLNLSSPNSLENKQGVTQSNRVEMANAKPTNTIEALLNDASLTLLLLGFFVLGLGLSLTPCVLPMMPILAGIITRQGDDLSSKQGGLLALFYVLGMSLSYSIAGVLVGLFGAELNLQAKLQTPWVLIPMASVFFLLALSMFGAFEIRLPGFISQKLNAKQDNLTRSNKSNITARYFNVALMGAIAALVVSPCVTAPLAGVLLYISGTGDAVLGASALFVLSLGMGVPLLLLGIGGGKLLPKSGVWMIEVKTLFAIILTAMGVYLLSRVMPDNLITLMICILLLFYSLHLFNLLKNKQNHALKNLAISIIGLTLVYTIALFLSVLVGESKPLTPLSFLASHSSNNQTLNSLDKKASLFVRFDRVDKMKEAIKKQPESAYMIDLYADWCASCKDIERDIFENPRIQAFQENMIFYQLDITDNLKEHTDYMSNNALFGPPSMLFYSKDAQEVGRYQGEPSLDDVIAFIKKSQLL